jgi:hypothetical protein
MVRQGDGTMTLDDALKTFGLKRLLTKPALKVLRDSQAKEAAARGDEDALIRINAAWSVLTGKSDAAPEGDNASTGPQGLIRAQCARKSGQVFILDWTMSPRAGQIGADKIVLDNPQLISWDSELGLFQIVGASGEAKPHFGETGGPSSAESGLFTQGWASQFRGEITFAPVACPCCQAQHIQWCQHCNTVFCHGGPKDTRDGRYSCSSCEAAYMWGGGGTPIQRVFDGKQLRSLSDLAPDGAIGTETRKALPKSTR